MSDVDNLCQKLRNGEYDGSDIMKCWILLEKLQAENAGLKKQNQWISVGDVVDCTDYLCTDGELVKELRYSKGLFFAYDGNPEPISGITHVMPLPTPPEGE